MARGELPQLRQILRGGRLEHAQHQRGRVVSHRQLDLRHALADREPGEKLGERRDEGVGRRGQHAAGGQVRHVGRGALTESDHHARLAVHVLGAEARPAPVAPGGTGERRQPPRGLGARHPRQGLLELALLGEQLRRRLEVLQRAAAADAEMWAPGHGALGRGLEHLEKLAIVMLAVAARAPEADALAGECAGHEHGLAATHHPLALVSECGDGRGLLRGGRRRAGRRRRTGSQAGSLQAARKRSKCGCCAARSQARTRSSSSACRAAVRCPRNCSNRR